VQRARPGRALIEQIPFRLGSARHEDPAEAFSGPWNLFATLAFGVHLEEHRFLETREYVRVGVQTETKPGRQDVVRTAPPDQPPGVKLHAGDEQYETK